MNDCPDEMMLTAWFDDELAGEPAERVGRHLDTCPECRAKVDDWNTLRIRVRTLPHPMVRRAAPTPHQGRRWVAILAAAALAGVTFGLHDSTRDPVRQAVITAEATLAASTVLVTATHPPADAAAGQLRQRTLTRLQEDSIAVHRLRERLETLADD